MSMSKQTTVSMQLTVAGREVTVSRKEQPYKKVNVFSNAEQVTMVESTIRYYYKGLSITVTMDQLREISPFMYYIMKHYTE